MRDVILKSGSHATREDGMCILEFCAFLAGEPHSACPNCVSVPELRRLSIRLNDARWPSDAERTRVIRPYAERLMSATATEAQRSAIRFRLADVAVREIAPDALERRGFGAAAAKLRRLPEIVDVPTARAAYAAAASAAARAAAFSDAAAYAADAAYAAAYAYASAAARAAAAADAAAARGAPLEKLSVRLLDAALALCDTKESA